MIKKIMKIAFIMVLYFLSHTTLFAQNKKEQIELLQIREDSLIHVLTTERIIKTQNITLLQTKVDSLLKVLTNERQMNTRQFNELNSTLSKYKSQINSLEKEKNNLENNLQAKNKELVDQTNVVNTLNNQLQSKTDSLLDLRIALKKMKSALSSYASLVKIDGKFVEWETVKIGSQIWMAENLNISTFSNGDVIPEAKTSAEWQKAIDNKQPAWCYYNNDPKNGEKYGKLYNWYAFNDKRGLAPEGWRIPTDWDWQILESILGGYMEAGNKMMKTIGEADLHEGTNISGFGAKPAGYRAELFNSVNEETKYWAKKTTEDFNAIELVFTSYTDGVHENVKKVVFSHGNYVPSVGLSVRLINDFNFK